MKKPTEKKTSEKKDKGIVGTLKKIVRKYRKSEKYK